MDLDASAFAKLFRDAYRRCFSAEPTTPLTESESLRLSVDIAESTGLEIGWKSLKNYSQYLLGQSGRVENPSTATRDTLARYVAGAPRTDERSRRASERHYPYWVRYREALRGAAEPAVDRSRESVGAPEVAGRDRAPTRRWSRWAAALAITLVAALIVTLGLATVADRRSDAPGARFVDAFDDVSAPALAARGWSVQAVDPEHWAQRGVMPGHLTLFALEGDNWPQSGRPPIIKNLVVRRLTSPCFAVDARFTSFFPQRNWQQAGIILLEDTTFAGRSARISIGYNDFAGGFPQTREVIVQGMTSLGRGSEQPEEVVHHRLFVVDSASEPLVRENLARSAVRFEKRGANLRLLYAAGPMQNAAFKEVGQVAFDFRPAYVALFAIEGFVHEPGDAAAHVDEFTHSTLSCGR